MITRLHSPEPSATRPGFVLLAVLLALVVLGLLGAGVLYASMQEFRDGRARLAQVAARSAAEAGLAVVRGRAAWDPAKNLSPAGTVVIRGVDVGPDVVDTLRIVALGNALFQVVSEARAQYGAHSAARARIGALLALTPPHLPVTAALIAAGAVVINASRVSGLDTTVGLAHDTSAVDMPAVSLGDSSALSTAACVPEGCLAGSSRFATDGGLASASIMTTDFGVLPETADHLLEAGAVITRPHPTLTVVGRCDRDNAQNWGDPLGVLQGAPCGQYAPVIHALGDLTIDGGVGQGTLLVDGNLRVSGGFSWHGAVLVRGSVDVAGDATRLLGGIVAGGSATIRAGAEVRRSSAELERAMMAAAHPVVATERWWIELPQ